jgi:hypothetical protein
MEACFRLSWGMAMLSVIDRFLRLACYQNLPAALLPPVLADGNPPDLWRMRDNLPGKKLIVVRDHVESRSMASP